MKIAGMINSEYRVKKIIYDIVSSIDGGRATDAERHFTADSVMQFTESAPNSGELSGINSVRNFFQTRQENKDIVTRHVIANIRVTDEADGTLTARYVFTVYRGTAGSTKVSESFVCDVTDCLREENGLLKIFFRQVNPIFIM